MTNASPNGSLTVKQESILFTKGTSSGSGLVHSDKWFNAERISHSLSMGEKSCS